MATNTTTDDEGMICPITHEIMVDPVVDDEGNSYERSAIEQWLKQHSTSPITRKPIGNLVPNRSLKDAIENKYGKKEQKSMSSDLTLPVFLAETSLISSNALQSDPSQTVHEVLITINQSIPNKTTVLRPPHDVICVVDISGSMSTNVTSKDQNGKAETFGYSLLDIVKHATKTVVSSLGSDDRFGLVVFDSYGSVKIPLTNVESTQKFYKIIDDLETRGSTNLWDGLKKAMDLFSSSEGNKRIRSIMLLTDGQPNDSPPHGEVASLTEYLNKMDCPSFTVHTFGFGYGIQNPLLYEISKAGGGLSFFIPDSSFVGTCFINAMSNILSTSARNFRLFVEYDSQTKIRGDTIDCFLLSLTKETDGNLVTVNLSSLQFQQSRTVLLRFQSPTNQLQLKINFGFIDNSGSSITSSFRYPMKLDNAVGHLLPNHYIALFRSMLYVSAFKYTISYRYLDHDSDHNQFLSKIKSDIESNPYRLKIEKQSSEFLEPSESVPLDKSIQQLNDLFCDLLGEFTLAFDSNYYGVWGRHYLLSLACAHAFEQCTNFKDPGIQHYGGEFFKNSANELNEIFNTLPPPKPSSDNYQRYNRGGNSSNYSSSVSSMQYFNSSSNVCFHPDTMITLPKGTSKRIADLKQGDVVVCDVLSEFTSKVVCLIKTKCENDRALMVSFESLTITPFHPFMINNRWAFPQTIECPSEVDCDYIYNVVLENHHTIMADSYQCLTLGHSIQNDPVASHPYFGSQLVIQDLQQMKGWNEGLIVLGTNPIIRDPITKLVCGLCQNVE